MYAKSFIARASRGLLTSAPTAKMYPYDHYVSHLCKSALVFHPEWGTHRPWFELTDDALTENGRQHCPYVVTAADEKPLFIGVWCGYHDSGEKKCSRSSTQEENGKAHQV